MNLKPVVPASKVRVIPWTCIVCNRAGDVSISGEVIASSNFIRRVHDAVSPHCKAPEILAVENSVVITLHFPDVPHAPVQTKVSAAYPD